MATIKEYFENLKKEELPYEVSEYIINNIILTDSGVDLLDDNDEDFLSVKSVIEKQFPSAVSVTPTIVEEVPSIEEASNEEEWQDAISTLDMLIDSDGSSEDVTEWKDAIDTLKMLLGA